MNVRLLLTLWPWLTTAAACPDRVIDVVLRSDREVLFSGYMPLSLATDPTTDTLYFNYFKVVGSSTVSKTANMNLRTKEYVNINGIDTSSSLSRDPKTHDLYIGTLRGVYRYSRENDKAELHGANCTSIGAVFFKEKLYFSDKLSHALYTIVEGKVERFSEINKADYFLIDEDDNMIFYNDTGLFKQKKGTNSAFIFDEPEDHEVFPNVRGLYSNMNGNVYAICDDGIYFVNTAKRVLEMKWHVFGANGIAFDSNNNLLYSDIRSVYRVKNNVVQNCD